MFGEIYLGFFSKIVCTFCFEYRPWNFRVLGFLFKSIKIETSVFLTIFRDCSVVFMLIFIGYFSPLKFKGACNFDRLPCVKDWIFEH